MKISIYPLIMKPQGKVPGDEFLAEVELTATGVKVECYDALLKEKLREIFSQPIIKRTPVGMKFGVFSHEEEIVRPFTEEFFQEILFSLHKYGLYGILKK